MSQVNKFNQLNNPDYVYFDLQQTNIYNTTTQEQQPLKFLETRETPVIKNTGDYYMSVARFQLDTYNLPVIVGEPDLTQTGTYDPDQTIYKVALTATNGSLYTASQPQTAYTLTSQIQQTPQSIDYGEIVITANTGTKNDICVLVTDRGFETAGTTNTGRVYIWKGTPTSNSIAHILSVPTELNYPYIGWGAGISNDGTKAVAGSNGRGVFLFNLTTGVVSPTYSAVIKPYTTLTVVALSGNGTRIFIGRLFQTGISNARATIYNYDTQTAVGAEINDNSGLDSMYAKGAYFNTAGDWFITSAYLQDSQKGYIEMRRYDTTSNTWIKTSNQFSATVNNDRLGSALAISGDGLYACGSTNRIGDMGNYIRIYKRTGNTFAFTTDIIGVNNILWGSSLSMSFDGSTLIVGTGPNNGSIYVYNRNIGLETYTLFNTITIPSPNYTNYVYTRSISVNSTGDAIFSTNAEKVYPANTLPVTIYNWTNTPAIQGGAYPLPTIFSTTPTIESVKWIKDVEDVTAPTKNSLTGKNTALYPYYYCYSYNNFITMVNKALKLAYKKLMEDIYNNWIVVLGIAGITNQFLSISARQYPTPPFIDWNETNLTADVYVSMLFETYQTAANAVIANINYAMPETVWGAGGGNSVGVALPDTPLKFELAFNAPLYSLFSSLPATKKVITNSTGKKELYYTLNFYSSGLGLVTPSPALNSIIPYSFLSTYTNASTGVVTIPTTGANSYSHSKLLIKQSQEISTIDTWTPVNAIVFTTTSIPIVVNQFTASSSIGSNPPSSSLDNAFAFIITDLQSNQQGYRPNILLTPKIYRMIDLTGNQPLKNIDINVFWRTKTGNLIPFTLASGAMSSIKLLFQKKVLGENQQINMASMTMRDII